MAYNRRQKDVLLKAAREEMQRQAIRRQIQELDDEILDVYKRLMVRCDISLPLPFASLATRVCHRPVRLEKRRSAKRKRTRRGRR